MNGLLTSKSRLQQLKLLRERPLLAAGLLALSLAGSVLTSGSVSDRRQQQLGEHIIGKYTRSVYADYNRSNGELSKVKMTRANRALLENLNVEFRNLGKSTPVWQPGSPKKTVYNFDYTVTANGEVVYEKQNVYKVIRRGMSTVRDSSAFVYYLNYFI